MLLKSISAKNFRCFTSLETEFDSSSVTVISGPNGSGKTSFLEAIYFLSRARSFRTNHRESLQQQGKGETWVYGEVLNDRQLHRMGIGYDQKKLTARLDGESVTSVANMAATLAVQVIDPQIHLLTSGGPNYRRRYLDWGVFHVEHTFISNWRRFERALRQRNTALRANAAEKEIRAWDGELSSAAENITLARAQHTEEIQSQLKALSSRLLGDMEITLSYSRGWSKGISFEESLEQNIDGDRLTRQTRYGPQRADLVIGIAGQPANEYLSRGQAKLLGICLVLTQLKCVETFIGKSILLLDDLASELDDEYLGRIMAILEETPSQRFMTVLDPKAFDNKLTADCQRFHVEQGKIRLVV